MPDDPNAIKELIAETAGELINPQAHSNKVRDGVVFAIKRSLTNEAMDKRVRDAIVLCARMSSQDRGEETSAMV